MSSLVKKFSDVSLFYKKTYHIFTLDLKAMIIINYHRKYDPELAMNYVEIMMTLITNRQTSG